jgi:HAE1 family hydrophobic/amphiphilic exporter-1
MLGLVLAIGIVVDDAIVVVEAVMHHIEHGLSPVEATKKAMKEVTGPVIAIALILTAVFVPVAMTGGITGRLYQQFAITIAISVLFSAFNALTLSPALSAMLLKPQKQMRGPLGKFFGLFNRIFDKITDKYVGLTGFFIKKLIRTVILLGGIVAVIVFLGKGIPSGFVPEEDQGYFLVNVILPDAASLERTSAICDKVEKILEKEKGIEMYNTVPGFSLLASSYIPNNGFFFVTLKPWEDRKAKEEHYKAIMARINAQFVKEISEATIIAVGPPAILGLGNASGYSFMLQDRGGNSPDYLQKEAAKFMNAAVQRPEIASSFSVYRANVPQYRINLDQNKAKKLGLSMDEVNQTLAAYLGSSYINDFNRFGRQYKTYIQAEAEYRINPQSLNNFFVRNNNNEMVPVSAVADVIPVSGPDMTNRFNMYRAAEIMGSPAPGYSSDDALNALEEVAKEVLPKDMGYEWSNMSFQEKEGAGQGATVFLYAMIFVFLILAAQYESWSLPFSVLLGTPFAVFGAFLGLWLARFISESYVNNVFAQIGLVMLIGLAAKNAILIVEFAKMKVEEGKSIIEAATEAAKLRFRPILMTAFAFILGVVPLVRAAGAGAESRKVMGMTVFSGMLIATILGVVLVPSLFVLIEKLGKKKKHAKSGETIVGEGH